MNSPKERRALLLKEMTTLGEEGLSCSACSGICCTYVKNSMQITPLETWDLYQWLLEQGRIDEALIQRLEACIERFRLDREVPGDGSRTFARRRYTCPFFSGESLGCTISRKHKPYGCLAFNASSTEVKDGEDCRSRTEWLEAIECKSTDDQNRSIARKLNIEWNKRPIPVALLEVIKKESGR
jgi:hypothetical protein